MKQIVYVTVLATDFEGEKTLFVHSEEAKAEEALHKHAREYGRDQLSRFVDEQNSFWAENAHSSSQYIVRQFEVDA